jgi:hypothetical protein
MKLNVRSEHSLPESGQAEDHPTRPSGNQSATSAFRETVMARGRLQWADCVEKGRNSGADSFLIRIRDDNNDHSQQNNCSDVTLIAYPKFSSGLFQHNRWKAVVRVGAKIKIFAQSKFDGRGRGLRASDTL